MKQSLPLEFRERMKNRFPDNEYQIFINSLDEPPVKSVRVNPRKSGHNSVTNQPVPWCEYGFYLDHKPVFTLDPLFHAGTYYPQEASSMVLWYLLKHIESEDGNNLTVLDLCGAPGGKSTLIASFLNENGLLVANEVIRSRAKILQENIIKWGAPNVVVTQSDPCDFGKLPGIFDVMVVDAPCSGEGMFRKGDIARNEWSVENTRICSERQKRILKASWHALKEKGWLVYSTCTFNSSENEEILNWLINEKGARVLKLEVPEAWGITTVSVGEGNGLAFFPHKVKGEGFFVALLQKTEESKPVKPPKSSGKKISVPSGVKRLVKASENFFFEENAQVWNAFPGRSQKTLSVLKKHLNVLHSGLKLGVTGRKGFVPDQCLAMSWVRSDQFPEIELSKETALRYLKGESITGVSGKSLGFYLVTCNRIPLGFVKNVGNRFNNLYPKEWRIRMNI
ncbi:methyltransferase RsmF C-terminal domain-like protein [Marinilabilia rubra]|uniref:RNA methyltransferase n=1 Tax=Marinilabilia rubra TaxID=2162893 RepID=A0A2U2BAY5_9BACT|nr:RNA methyltransferase [Marinilabilia rubra]PWE00219.1 RNA methyltransferase [Marinilabilia rubra]